MTLLSRITGLARESLKAVTFGAGLQMDAFEAAFRLPNILRRLFAEGAFSQAFVPVLPSTGGSAARRHAGARRTRRDAPRRGAAGAVGAGHPRRAVAGLPAGGRVRADTGQGRAHGGDDPHHVSVHPVHLARVARRRRAERLSAVRDPCVHAGAAQPVDHRRGDLPGARTWRSPIVALAWGVAIGGVRNWRSSGRPLAKIGMLPRRCFDWRDDGVRRVLRGHGSGGARRVGGADLRAHQYAARLVAR